MYLNEHYFSTMMKVTGSEYPTEIDIIISDMGTRGDWLMKDLLVKQNAQKSCILYVELYVGHKKASQS